MFLVLKNAEVVGLGVDYIRSRSTFIARTNVFSTGLVPMLRVCNNTTRHVHHDVSQVWQLRRNTTDAKEIRATNPYFTLLILDLVV
nr:hypothetical transcript [Hymenolepis microstoma]